MRQHAPYVSLCVSRIDQVRNAFMRWRRQRRNGAPPALLPHTPTHTRYTLQAPCPVRCTAPGGQPPFRTHKKDVYTNVYAHACGTCACTHTHTHTNKERTHLALKQKKNAYTLKHIINIHSETHTHTVTHMHPHTHAGFTPSALRCTPGSPPYQGWARGSFPPTPTATNRTQQTRTGTQDRRRRRRRAGWAVR